MALKSGNVRMNPVVYKHDPKREREHDQIVDKLKQELEEARRKSHVKAAMAAPQPNAVDISEKEKAWNSEREKLMEDYNKSLREISELRKFQKPVRYIDQIVEKIVEKPVETIVEKIVIKKVPDIAWILACGALCGLMGGLIERFFK